MGPENISHWIEMIFLSLWWAGTVKMIMFLVVGRKAIQGFFFSFLFYYLIYGDWQEVVFSNFELLLIQDILHLDINILHSLQISP